MSKLEYDQVLYITKRLYEQQLNLGICQYTLFSK